MVHRRAAEQPQPSQAPRYLVHEDEAALVERIRRDDRAAFEVLFREFYRPLCAFAQPYVGSLAEAEELVQEIFLNIWRQRATWEVRGTVRNYLFGAARNRGLDQARRARRAAHWAEQAGRASDETPDASLMAAVPVDAHTRLERDEFTAAVVRVVSTFPARQREAYVLRWAHHLTVPEIAAAMGVTTKCVEAQLTKSAKVLRRTLARYT